MDSHESLATVLECEPSVLNAEDKDCLTKKRLIPSGVCADQNNLKKTRSHELNENSCTPEENTKKDEELLRKIREQVEYYFSDDNLKQDKFFHNKMSENSENWLDMKLILSCRKIISLNGTQDQILKALEISHLKTKIDENGSAWVRRCMPLPMLNPNAKTKSLTFGQKHEKRSPGCPTRLEDIHQLGCFLRISEIPQEASWVPVKKSLQSAMPDSKTLRHVTSVSSDGVAYVYCRPFSGDIEFFRNLKSIDVNDKQVTVELVDNLNSVNQIITSHLPKNIVRDRCKEISRLKSEKKSMPLTVGGTTFENIEHLRKCCKELLDITPAGESLKPTAFHVIRSLLDYHPNSSKKLHEIESIKTDLRTDIALKANEEPPKCFFVVRKDGSCEDFSIKKCLERILNKPVTSCNKETSTEPDGVPTLITTNQVFV